MNFKKLENKKFSWLKNSDFYQKVLKTNDIIELDFCSKYTNDIKLFLNVICEWGVNFCPFEFFDLLLKTSPLEILEKHKYKYKSKFFDFLITIVKENLKKTLKKNMCKISVENSFLDALTYCYDKNFFFDYDLKSSSEEINNFIKEKKSGFEKCEQIEKIFRNFKTKKEKFFLLEKYILKKFFYKNDYIISEKFFEFKKIFNQNHEDFEYLRHKKFWNNFYKNIDFVVKNIHQISQMMSEKNLFLAKMKNKKWLFIRGLADGSGFSFGSHEISIYTNKNIIHLLEYAMTQNDFIFLGIDSSLKGILKFKYKFFIEKDFPKGSISECSICYENKNLLKLNCKHEFCSECLNSLKNTKNIKYDAWINYGYQPYFELKCPYCRKNFELELSETKKRTK